MSIRDFHAQLVSGNNKNNLFSALSKISRIADPKSLFTEEPANDWPVWEDQSGQMRSLTPSEA